MCSFMDYEFSSQKELFMRVRPALRSKCSELKRLGYSKIKEFDIWNYLIIKKWKQAQGLMLSDIVNDIMGERPHVVIDPVLLWDFEKDKNRISSGAIFFFSIK